MDKSKSQQGEVGGKVLNTTIAMVAIAMVVYHLISAHFYILGLTLHQNTHLTFALLLVWMASMRSGKKRFWPLTILLILLSLVCTGYVHFNFEYLEFHAGEPDPILMVLIIGTILIVLLLEATRRSFGLVLPIVMILFVLYTFFGYLLPGYFQSTQYSTERILARMGIGCFALTGIYGTILNISATMIFLFMVFGALLRVSGATRFFIQVGRWVGGRLAGGPALTSVVTSALVGMVTGSVAANIATTGSFTIPLMKKVGYTPYQAGAIEATASTGGQIMPPVMGAAAFILVGFTGIPYINLCAMAAIPAVLYFLSAGLYAQFQAMKREATSETIRIVEKIDVREILLFGPLFVVPLLFIIVLLTMHFPLGYTMSLTIVLIVILSFIRKETRQSLGTWVTGFTEGAVTGSQVAVSCGAIGLMLAAISMTALHVKIPFFVEGASGGNLMIALLMAMVASIILGMGVATITSYIVVAIVVGPALMTMGLNMLQAHLFSFYFAVIAYLTPPVAIGAIIAAKVADAPFLKTAIEGCKVALGGFIVPYLMVWCPVLLLQPGADALWAATGVMLSFVLILVLQALICGHYLAPISNLEKGVYAITALMLFLSLPGKLTLLAAAGIGLFLLATAWQWLKRRRLATHALEATRLEPVDSDEKE